MRKIASRRGIMVALTIIAGIFLLSRGLTFAGVGTATPTIVTTPNPSSGPAGTVLNDTATLSDGDNPTGTITFKLYGLNDQACGAAPIFTNTVPVSGNGVYSTSTGFPTVEAGTYHWVASYSGDVSNDSVSSICANEAVVISKKATGGQGESVYIGIVGNDCVVGFDSINPDQPCVANPFYFSAKHQQFLLDQEDIDVPVCFGDTWPTKNNYTRVGAAGCEQFRSNRPINQPEICDVGGEVSDFGKGEFITTGNPNAMITKQNAGWFEWFIRLPKKPSGEINICIQCGVLKPNTFTPFTGFKAVEQCAAETGERIETGSCTRNQQDPGVNPIVNTALPMLTVKAYPGPYNPDETFTDGFYLTAFKNPSTYGWTLETDAKMKDSYSLQVLDGSENARILLKACLDKCVVAKIPVTGTYNSKGQQEYDLEAGDVIYIKMQVPLANTVDIYCHSQSAKIAGVGEGPF